MSVNIHKEGHKDKLGALNGRGMPVYRWPPKEGGNRHPETGIKTVQASAAPTLAVEEKATPLGRQREAQCSPQCPGWSQQNRSTPGRRGTPNGGGALHEAALARRVHAH